MNSESRHLTEQSTKSTELLEANREHDVEFAEIVAIFLNSMMHKNVLTQEAVQNASLSAFEELIVRYWGVVGAGGQNFYEEKKLKALFPSPSIEKGKREQEVAELVILMKNFFHEVMQRDKVKQILKGLLLYGSRMNPDALPREKTEGISDIDIIWVADIDDSEMLTKGTDLVNLIREEWSRKKYPVPLDVAWFKGYSVNLFTPCVNSSIAFERFPGGWWWKPQAVYYIGTLPNMDEEEVNRRLREQLESDEVREIKQMWIQKIKNFIKAEDRNFYKIKGDSPLTSA